MSERTRMEIWEEIKASELLGSDVVTIPIDTAKLLLESVRLVNEIATRAPDSPNSSLSPRWLYSVNEAREKAGALSRRL